MHALSVRSGFARILLRHTFQQFAPAQQNALRRIRKNHFAGSQAMTLGDARFVQVNQPGFRAGNHQAIVRHGVAHRPQTVAIQLRANGHAVTKHQRRGAVPRFGFMRQRFQRAAHIAGKKRIMQKRRRHQREHRCLNRLAFEQLDFQRVIKAGGIADVFFEQMKPFANANALADFAFASAQPAAVTDHGINFAVVGHVAERLRELPGRLRVGGIALVENGEVHGKFGTAEILEETRKLPGGEQDPCRPWCGKRVSTDSCVRAAWLRRACEEAPGCAQIFRRRWARRFWWKAAQ